MPSEKDIKLLWGRASGHCSYCNINLTMLLETTDITIGEMSHVIAQKENGPRGSEEIDEAILNTYKNLILLCPTHHTMIDKAPQDFSVDQILGWKTAHEEKIFKALKGERFISKELLFNKIKKILCENKAMHSQFGPESNVAITNPTSTSKASWDIYKVSIIIPNNRKIINIVAFNEELLSPDEYSIFIKFKAHAISFEKNAYERQDGESVSTFPKDFEKMIYS